MPPQRIIVYENLVGHKDYTNISMGPLTFENIYDRDSMSSTYFEITFADFPLLDGLYIVSSLTQQLRSYLMSSTAYHLLEDITLFLYKPSYCRALKGWT